MALSIKQPLMLSLNELTSGATAAREVLTMLLELGNSGAAVKDLQRLLLRHGVSVALDGVFDEATEKAVRLFQDSVDLVADGIAGVKTLTALRGGDRTEMLGHSDLVRAAARLAVDVASVYAVNAVESSGSGFLKGVVRILYERHQMRRQLLANRPDLDVMRLQARHPNLVNDTSGGYIGNDGEWSRLYLARQIDERSALESASWGAFQIMGYHWKRLGYPNVFEFAASMQRSESAQLDAFVRFIETDPALHSALKRRDWARFARIYNGAGYAKNQYDTKLASAYTRHAAVHGAAA